MPTVTITYTDEEKVAYNAKGDELGYAKCAGCGNSRLWAVFHEVYYESVPVPPNNVIGHFSCAFLCEECWRKMSKDQRAEATQRALLNRPLDVKGILKREINGVFQDCPIDTERHAQDLLKVYAGHDKILDAVRGEDQ